MLSPASTRPRHRRASSSPQYPTRDNNTPKQMPSTSDDVNHPPSPRPWAASRIIHSVKRTLVPSSGPKKRHPEYSKTAGHSTFAESRSLSPSQQFREPDPTSSRPSIEQIAMGLHISRTPHLRPLRSSPYAFSRPNSAPHSAHPYEHPHHRATPITLPPPPSRSSMKKPTATATSSSSSPALSPPFSHASGSSTTVTSVTPSSAQLPRSFAIKFRMARFLPYSRSVSAPTSMVSSPTDSPQTSTSELPHPKKAVRFTTEEVDGG